MLGGLEVLRLLIYLYSLDCFVFVLVAPLELHSTIQRLGLVPFWPLFPSVKAIIPFTSWSLIQPVSLPSNLDRKTLWQLLLNLASSPTVLAYLLIGTRRAVRKKLYRYLRICFIKPDNPDADSITAAVEDGLDNQRITALGFFLSGRGRTVTKESATIREQARRDWNLLKSAVDHFFSDWSSTISILRTGCIPGHQLRTPQAESYAEISVQKFELLLPDVEVEPADVVPPDEVAIDTVGSQHLNNISQPEALRVNLSQDLDNSGSTPGNPDQEDHSDDPSRIMAATQDALPKDLLAADPSRPCHRVTVLTALAADNLAAQMSTHLADWLSLPLEALFVRSIALAFASSRTAPLSAPWLRSEIYPLGSWFGMGIRSGRAGDYILRTVLCCGVEMALGLGVWQMTTGLAWWFGTRKHGWGKL